MKNLLKIIFLLSLSMSVQAQSITAWFGKPITACSGPAATPGAQQVSDVVGLGNMVAAFNHDAFKEVVLQVVFDSKNNGCISVGMLLKTPSTKETVDFSSKKECEKFVAIFGEKTTGGGSGISKWTLYWNKLIGLPDMKSPFVDYSIQTAASCSGTKLTFSTTGSKK